MSVRNESYLATLAYILLFAAAFWLGPWQFSEQFTEIPGDLGDARLNAYFLENVYQYLLGNSESLWHFGFYYPFPYTVGFSDNLFGLSPLFILFRIAGVDAYSSFLYWFMSGYVLNFASSLYVLRKLGLSPWAAGLGALVFTFGLPVTGHSGHAQLHHRFGIPLVTLFFIRFVQTKDLRNLLVSYFWLVWQFFTGVYIGFFAFLLLFGMTFCYLVFPYTRERKPLQESWNGIRGNFKALSNGNKMWLGAGFVLLSLAMIWLFYPYLQVKELYGFDRSWGEVKGMLPRIYSYIFAPSSTLWDFKFKFFNNLSMSWEHQMFPGMVPFVLGLLGLGVGLSKKSSLTFKLIVCGFLFIFAITLRTGSSWWKYFHYLPLFSAIRAMTRIDLLYLLFYGFLAGYLLDLLCKRKPLLIGLSLLFSGLFVYESGQMRTQWNKKTRWELKENELAAVLLSQQLPKGSVFFIAQMSTPEYEHEVTSMWLALKHGYKTMNGYSGNGPEGYDNKFGKKCGEFQRRLESYQRFTDKNQLKGLQPEEVAGIAKIGFENCP